jgi:hypothetical protein
VKREKTSIELFKREGGGNYAEGERNEIGK